MDTTDTGTEFSAGTIAAVNTAIHTEMNVKHNRMDRREAIHYLRNVWATIVADDVAAGRTPWVGTVDSYRYVAHLDEGYGARLLLPYTATDSPLYAGYVELAAIADADEATNG